MTFREKKENPGGKPTGVRVLLAAFQLLKCSLHLILDSTLQSVSSILASPS